MYIYCLPSAWGGWVGSYEWTRVLEGKDQQRMNTWKAVDVEEAGGVGRRSHQRAEHQARHVTR